MKREIYEVYAKVVDANGAYNTLSGYPKSFDSHQFSDDLEKAKKRAYAEYWDVLGVMGKRDDRQQQIAMIIRASDGLQIEKTALGKVADLPDPTYAVTVTNGIGSGSYKKDAVVTIGADDPAEGKMFSAWTGADNLVFVSGSATSAYASFRMPAEAVALVATYVDIPTYAVTVTNGSGSGYYAAGVNVTIDANAPEEGKIFSAWVGANNLTFIEGDATTSTATFIMPAEAVTLEATYVDIPTYTATVINGSGSGSYAEGADVTITADAPAEGKVFSSWVGADNLTFVNGDATTVTATFNMPAETVTLEATYVDISPEPEGE